MVNVPYALGFDIYKKSPLLLQDFFDILIRPLPRAIMFGDGFHEKLKFLQESEKWSYDRLVKFQEKKLRFLIEHAYKNVPYYHEIFNRNNLYPADIRTIKDLKKLPILTKDDIRNNFDKLMAVNYKEFKPGLGYTSGSTGKPLEFYLDQQTREIEYASVWRQAFWSGIENVNVKIATLRGDLASEYGKTNRFYKYNGLTKEMVINTYLLDKEHVDRIIKKLNEFKPALIKGFPHALYIVARCILEEKINLNFKPKIIQTSSEQLTFQMFQTIEKGFDSKIFDWYSQSEYVLSIGQCEHGTYHQNMEAGILEVIEDEYGFERICGTGLWNYSMPFIRYEVGDLIKIGKQCRCGRGLLALESLEGRIDDMIITPGGKVISGAGFIHYWKNRIFTKLKIIPEYIHFLQEKLNKITIEIYSTQAFLEEDEKMMLNELGQLFGEGIAIEFNYLSELPSIKKWRFVESKVKL